MYKSLGRWRFRRPKEATNIVYSFPRDQTLTSGFEAPVFGSKENLWISFPPSPDKMIRLLFCIFRWMYSKALGIIYRRTSRTIPTIKTSLLVESASSLANRIRNQKVTSVEVVRSYINRIREVDEVLNCVVDGRYEEALIEAEKADELIRSGAKSIKELETETPFLGVPFTVPDSVALKGLLNTLGLKSKKNKRADMDAGIVVLMKEGGAIPLACTNVSESCLARETYNPVFGRTCNPYNTSRSVGGPFGGEACLIASSGSPMGIAPSVRLPSAFNGIFGHEVSADARNEAACPMSRNSADLLPALKLLTKYSKTDLNLDKPVDVKKLKYYFMYGNGVSEEIKQAIQKAADHFRNSHKVSVQQVELKTLKNIFSTIRFCRREAPPDENEKINLRKELVKVLFGKSQHTFLFLLTSLIEEKLYSPRDSTKINEAYSQVFDELQELLGTDGVFLCPTHPTPAYRHNESLLRVGDRGYEAVFETLGFPATHCPAGLDSSGLPIGFQVIAAMNQDRLTVAVASEIDKAFGGWKPPPTHGTFTLKNTVFRNSLNEKFKTL